MVIILSILAWIFCGVSVVAVLTFCYMMFAHAFSTYNENRRNSPWYKKDWVWMAICMTSLLLFSVLYNLAHQLSY